MLHDVRASQKERWGTYWGTNRVWMPGIGVRGEGRYVLSRIGTSTTVVLGQEPTKPATIPMPPAMPPATPPLPFDTGNESKDIDNTARTPAIAHENITICLPGRYHPCA